MDESWGVSIVIGWMAEEDDDSILSKPTQEKEKNWKWRSVVKNREKNYEWSSI